MNEKASKGRFLKAEKERRRREKVMVALLVFIIATFWPKKLSDAKGPSGDNVFKNRARDCQTPVYHTQILEKLGLPGTNLLEGIRLSPQTSKFPCANE